MGLPPDSDSPVQHEKSILMKAYTQRPCCLLFFMRSAEAECFYLK